MLIEVCSFSLQAETILKELVSDAFALQKVMDTEGKSASVSMAYCGSPFDPKTMQIGTAKKNDAKRSQEEEQSVESIVAYSISFGFAGSEGMLSKGTVILL